MKKIVVQVILLIVIIVLAFFVYESILEPVRFDKEKRALIINQLSKKNENLHFQLMYQVFYHQFENYL